MLSPAGSSDVAEVMITQMLTLFIRGDIIRQAVREANNLRKGIVSLLVVSREFTGKISATSGTLQGYVIEDGGAAVTVRGIAWAGTYNPTTEDYMQASGSGTGSLAIRLTDLPKEACIMQGLCHRQRRHCLWQLYRICRRCSQWYSGKPACQ